MKTIETTFRRDGITHVNADGFALLNIDHYHIKVGTFEESGKSWREMYEDECDQWEDVVKAHDELAGKLLALQQEYDDLKALYEELRWKEGRPEFCCYDQPDYCQSVHGHGHVDGEVPVKPHKRHKPRKKQVFTDAGDLVGILPEVTEPPAQPQSEPETPPRPCYCVTCGRELDITEESCPACWPDESKIAEESHE